MIPFVNCVQSEQERKESMEAWKKDPEESEYWKYYMQHINSSNVLILTQMLLRCAPLSDCRVVFEQALSNSLAPILSESDHLVIVATILPSVLSLLKNDMDRNALHQVVESVERLLSLPNYTSILSFLYFCESLLPTQPDAVLEVVNLLTEISNHCDENTIAVKVMKKIRSSLKRIAVKIKADKHLSSSSSSCADFLALFDWESILSPKKRKAQGRLYNRNPAINELLREEAGSDNYDDLTNFIDPSPDISIREVRQMF